MNPPSNKKQRELKLMLVSIVPPRDDNGVRIVMHRHLVERSPFDLHVASNADFADDLLIHTRLRLPTILHRLCKSRFRPRLGSWLQDYENHIWPLHGSKALDRAIEEFKPDVILTLAETGVCHLACKAARKHGIPLAGLFLDWFPIMKPYFGHKYWQPLLKRRYRKLYAACDLAICTSDGMKAELGPHSNSHVIYPMPGRHHIPADTFPPPSGKFRLVYVGAAQGFYGRMLRSLLNIIRERDNLELVIVGPVSDWPEDELARAQKDGHVLGAMPPAEAAKVLAGADALLVVMSFEKEFELFMRTSFTTKFLDYAAFGKPVMVWGPSYCSPMRVVEENGGALAVQAEAPEAVADALASLEADANLQQKYADEARHLNRTLFNPDRLQSILVDQIRNLVHE